VTAADDEGGPDVSTVEATTARTVTRTVAAPVLRGSQRQPWAGAGPERCPHCVPNYLTGRVRRWYVRAAQQHNCGRPDQAAQLLVSAVTHEPSFGCLREALARAQFDAGQYLAARTTFTAMVALDPRDHYATFGLGLVATALGVPGAATGHFERAVELSPDEPRYAVALEHARATLAHSAPAAVGSAGESSRNA